MYTLQPVQFPQIRSPPAQIDLTASSSRSAGIFSLSLENHTGSVQAWDEVGGAVALTFSLVVLSLVRKRPDLLCTGDLSCGTEESPFISH